MPRSARSPRSGRSAPGARRRVVAVLIGMVAAGLAVAAITSGGGEPPRGARTSAPPEPFTVGAGARGARVLPGRGSRRRATVVFLHGWGLVGPDAYGAWLRHLSSRGSTVIVPRYQTSLRTDPLKVPEYALAGIRAAVRRVRPRPRRVVVIGHSVGGVLAVDYAARAKSLRLPQAAGLMVIYPGGAIKDRPPVPEEDPAQIPEGVRRLIVLVNRADPLVGTTTGEAIAAGAVNVPTAGRQLIEVESDAADEHFAPALNTPQARREFWRRADRLIRELG